jgi:hypothetical protein
MEMHQAYWGADEVDLIVWDCVGKESHRAMTQHFLHGSHGGACLYTVVWDVSEGGGGGDHGFARLRREIDALCSVVADPQIFIVGTHIDVLLDRAVEKQRARRMSGGHGDYYRVEKERERRASAAAAAAAAAGGSAGSGHHEELPVVVVDQPWETLSAGPLPGPDQPKAPKPKARRSSTGNAKVAKGKGSKSGGGDLIPIPHHIDQRFFCL